MPYLSVLADFRADVRKIAREQKGEKPGSNVSSWKVSFKGDFLLSDGAAAAVRPRT